LEEPYHYGPTLHYGEHTWKSIRLVFIWNQPGQKLELGTGSSFNFVPYTSFYTPGAPLLSMRSAIIHSDIFHLATWKIICVLNNSEFMDAGHLNLYYAYWNFAIDHSWINRVFQIDLSLGWTSKEETNNVITLTLHMLLVPVMNVVHPYHWSVTTS
jgi:hypothetical protein